MIVTVSSTDLAWAAGAVDGEGCISIRSQRVPNSKFEQYALYISVGNTDIRMPQRLAEMFGGNVINKTRQQERRPVYEWRIFSANAVKVLKMLRPYLVIKGEQADIAIEFGKTLARTGGHSAEVRAAREQMKARIAVLKREEAV